MAQAFPGAYVDQGLTQRGPFSQVSTAVDVKNPRDLGGNRAYTNSRANPPRSQNYSSQQTAPKPFPGKNSKSVSYDPYANGGGVADYLEQ